MDGSWPAGRSPANGHPFAPVVLADVPPEAGVMREEIFGPIVAIRALRLRGRGLGLADDHDAGLAAYLLTCDLERAMRPGAAIEAGMVAVNRGRVSCVPAPFSTPTTRRSSRDPHLYDVRRPATAADRSPEIAAWW